MADVVAVLQIDEPGGSAARWNFPDAIGTPPDAPGGIGDPATVSFSFMQTLPGYETLADHPGFTVFDAALQAATRQALATWEAACNVTFVEVPDAGEGGLLRFGRNDMAGGGYTWFPNYAYALDNGGLIAAATPLARPGDVWLSTATNIDGQAPGGYGTYALVHEIGHAIGLKHPFEGVHTLPVAEADLAHSIMAYAPPANMGVVSVSGSPASYSWTIGSLYPAGPMLDDIAAAQVLYGANMSSHAGDDDYHWAPGERFLQTIWDAGGTDAIDAANQVLPCVIDLNAGHASSIGIRATDAAKRAELPDWATAAPTPTYDGRDNLWIAEGVTIEHAFGGAGDDLLVGNAADNVLIGGLGDDTLVGGGGWDNVVLHGPRAATSLEQEQWGDWVATGPDGRDVLWQIAAVWFDDGPVILAGQGLVA